MRCLRAAYDYCSDQWIHYLSSTGCILTVFIFMHYDNLYPCIMSISWRIYSATLKSLCSEFTFGANYMTSLLNAVQFIYKMKVPLPGGKSAVLYILKSRKMQCRLHDQFFGKFHAIRSLGLCLRLIFRRCLVCNQNQNWNWNQNQYDKIFQSVWFGIGRRLK